MLLPSGPANTRCSACRFEPRSLSRARNGFAGPRDRQPKSTLSRPQPAAETARPHLNLRKRRKLRAIPERPGNIGSHRTAWWGWKDSNLQPDYYELEGLEPQPGRYERTSSAAQKSDFPAYGTKGLKVPARHAVLSNESPARPGTGCRRARAPR